MSDFTLWFTEGWRHIADVRAYDHILFLVVLFAGCELKDWKKMMLLITAFTIGHSVTLALSVLSIVKIKTSMVEFLIPCTILATALYNLFTLKKTDRNIWFSFIMTIFFGMIHGLGFSTLLRSLLGKLHNITFPLFSFNLGLEVGQLIIISFVLTATIISVKIFRISSHHWRFFLSSAAFGIAFLMAIDRL